MFEPHHTSDLLLINFNCLFFPEMVDKVQYIQNFEIKTA